MFKFIFFALVLIFISERSKSQILRSKSFDSNSVIKDSSGKIIPYNIWNGLMSSGDYYIINRKLSNSEDTSWILVKLSDEEQERKAKRYKPQQCPFFQIGQGIDIKMKDINGNSYDKKNLDGKIVVIWFWYIDEFSNYSFAPLNRLVDSFTHITNVIFLSVCIQDKPSLLSLLQNNIVKFNMVANGKPIAEQLGINRYPAYLIVDKTGKIYYQTCGMSTSTIYWLKKSI
jgi:hypothetical protein